MSKHKYIDLFAGCGGLSLGLFNSKIWEGIFAVEKNEDAFKTLSHNLIENRNHFEWPKWLPKRNHDINQILKDYRSQLLSLRNKVDLVAGGPPCQGFSTAGQRHENDDRNKLIKSYIRFIRIVQPKIIFFENVKGFTQRFEKNRLKGKRYSEYVMKQLKMNNSYYNSIGYKVFGKLVDFSEYGIPQKRTRFILIGFRKDLFNENPEELFNLIDFNCLSFTKSKGISLNTNLSEAISDLSNDRKINYPNNESFKTTKYKKPNSNYQKLLRQNVSSAIPDSHRLANHKGDTQKKFNQILTTAERNKPLRQELKLKLNIKKRTTIPTDCNQQAPSLTTLPDDYVHYREPRIFTVREYARIQSFNDWYEFKGKYTTGGKRRKVEVPRYSQIGNAIPPLFAEQVGLALEKFISYGQ